MYASNTVSMHLVYKTDASLAIIQKQGQVQEETELAMPPKEKSGSVTNAVYKRVKQAIMRGELEPGMILSENDVAADFGCSRTPAREALQKLSLEGFVALTPRRGYVVTVPSMRDTSEGYQLREILEGEAAALAAARMAPEVLSELEECMKANELQLRPFNYRFHTLIAEAAGNRRLKGLVGQLIDEMSRVEELDPGMQSPEYMNEHRDIVDALRAGNATAAKEAMLRHIRVSRDRIMRRI